MSKLGDVGHRLYTGEVQYDFVGRKKIWYCLSATIVLLAIGGIVLRGLNFGIEFKGGADFRVPSGNCSIEQVRDAVAPYSQAEPIVQEAKAVGGQSTLRVQTDDLPQGVAPKIQGELATLCQVAADDITYSEISGTWGGEVTKKALTSLIVFLLLVSVFIRILFETKMAIAALFALAHDLVITAGLYALVGFEVTPATVIGMLTILGYSLYDTIVVFDSLRENTRNLTKQTKRTYSEAANLSVNQTLVRSINTSVIALLPIGAILVVGTYLLGAGVLKDLALVLFIGIAASTFSSIFFATPLLADLKEREPEMQALRKRIDTVRAKEAARGFDAGPSGLIEPGGSTALLERTEEATGEAAGPTASRFTGAPARPAGRPSSKKNRPSGKKPKKRG
jgi:preprotein translocase subunit SecF